MATDAEIAAQRRAADMTTTRLRENAKTSPRETTGGGGFKSNAPGSGADKAADPPGKYDGGLSGGVIHTADQENAIINKAEHGVVITDDDLGYMGHFANDDVMRRGHNVGMRKPRKAAVNTLARRGFHKLPGSAAPQIGHARYGDAPTGLPEPRHVRERMAKADRALKRSMKKSELDVPMPLGKPFAHPRAISDVKMSIRHHEESKRNDVHHLKDHKASIARHDREIAMRKKQLKRGR